MIKCTHQVYVSQVPFYLAFFYSGNSGKGEQMNKNTEVILSRRYFWREVSYIGIFREFSLYKMGTLLYNKI